MYIPPYFLENDKDKIVAFMQQNSFATIVNTKDIPIATHLPFVVEERDGELILLSHFARANEQWQYLEQQTSLVIFSGPHAYISPRLYDKELNVPTWNYVSVHAYGKARIITDENGILDVLAKTIKYYEPAYNQQWEGLPEKYKSGMVNGIVAFEITVTDLQAKKKLSQNRSEAEQKRIIEALNNSEHSNEKQVAAYMK